jgi:hypothetical protein
VFADPVWSERSISALPYYGHSSSNWTKVEQHLFEFKANTALLCSLHHDNLLVPGVPGQLVKNSDIEAFTQ